MNTCIVSGLIVHSDGTPFSGVLVFVVPAASPALTSTGFAIHPMPIQAITNDTGYFELTLIRNMDFIVTINAVGFRGKIRVPNLDEYDMFAISHVPIVVDPTPTDTGEENW